MSKDNVSPHITLQEHGVKSTSCSYACHNKSIFLFQITNHHTRQNLGCNCSPVASTNVLQEGGKQLKMLFRSQEEKYRRKLRAVWKGKLIHRLVHLLASITESMLYPLHTPVLSVSSTLNYFTDETKKAEMNK